VARRQEMFLQCDQCGRKGAETWKIVTPQSESCKVDLCSRCDDYLRKAFIAGRKGASGPVGVEAIKVTSEEEFASWRRAQERK
jgi:hypothetical protein